MTFAFRRPWGAAKLTLDRKALVVAELLVAALGTYRVYDYLTTGFFVSDEFGYYYDAVHGTVYGGRWFFGWFNIALFRAFGVATPDGFAVILPFYLFFWTGLTVYLFYKTAKLLGLDARGTTLCLASSFALVSFVLLSLGFLTEPVGLALAMGGIYFLLRFQKAKTEKEMIFLPLGAAGLLGAAGGTREPYNALLVAGVLVVAVLALAGLRAKSETGVEQRRLVALLAIALFAIPSGYLYYANSYATSQAPAIGEQVGHAILTNPPIVTETTLTKTVTENTTLTHTSEVTQTATITATTNGTTTIVSSSGTVTTTITKTVPQTVVRTTVNSTTLTVTSVSQATRTTVVTTEANYPFYAKSLLLNTAAIFAGGIVLGWGPLAAIVGVVGMLVLLKLVLSRREPLHLLVLFLSLAALGSYFVVSYIFAPDPGYLSFRNYSTIIRFSDTALPAYFLLAPFAISWLSRGKRGYAFAAAILIFLLAAVPTYQVYASSNLNYAAGNPFSLGYRTPAIQVRDYISSHPGGSFNIVGVPYGWYFTPGVGGLEGVKVYPLSTPALTPPLNYSQFLGHRWTTFYVYSSPSFTEVSSYAPYLYPLVSQGLTNSSAPFHILSSTVVLNGTGFVLVRVQLAWA